MSPRRVVARAVGRRDRRWKLCGAASPGVDSDVDIREVARQIAFGKFFCAGQTSAAPDYVLVPERCEKPLIDALAAAIRETFGEDPSQSPHYARIENPEQFALLEGMRRDGERAIGGEARAADGYIPPTVLRNVSPSATILSAEVLGPVLPVLRVSGMTEAIDFVNDRDHPLALYVFAGDEDAQELVVEQTRSATSAPAASAPITDAAPSRRSAGARRCSTAAAASSRVSSIRPTTG